MDFGSLTPKNEAAPWECWGYLEELELSEQDLYDAQGTSFDPQAICLRLREGLTAWASGTYLQRHAFPELQVVRGAYI